MKYVVLFLVLMQCSFAADYFDNPINTEKGNPENMQGKTPVKLPEDFKARLILQEPMVMQPIAFTFDFKGRLWIVECHNQGAAGGKKPWDRVVFYEDTTGDGKFDSRKVFWEVTDRKTTSVQIGMGGVWIMSVPELIFIPDADYDGVADGKPQVLLDGWHKRRASEHTIANGLFWGPDGWLYGRVGILTHDKVGKPGTPEKDRERLNVGIWRIHPVSKKFEVVTRGMTNPWGMDYDKHGQIFVINTVIGHLWHVVPGAYVRRMFGKPYRPHIYEPIEQVADHVHWSEGEKWTDIRKTMSNSTSDAGGGHAHTGLMIYQGDNWPDKYRDDLYTINFHGRRFNREKLLRQGSAYTATHMKDLAFFEDEWFRGVDLKTGPDGAVYVIDWSDTGECHDYVEVHRTSGRVYKIFHGNEPSWKGDLTKLTNDELVKLQSHKNVWFARRARVLLQERALAGKDMKSVHESMLKVLSSSVDVPLRLKALWTLNLTKGLNETLLKGLLNDSNEHIRLWVMRTLVEDAYLKEPVEQFLAERAKKEKSKLARLYAVALFNYVPIEKRISLAEAFSVDSSDNGDKQYPHLIWSQTEKALLSNMDQTYRLFSQTKLHKLKAWIARRLIFEVKKPDLFNGLVKYIAEIKDEAAMKEVLNSIEIELVNQERVSPSDWPKLQAAVINMSPEIQGKLASLSLKFVDDKTLELLKKIVLDSSSSLENRKYALQRLAKVKDSQTIMKAIQADKNLVNDGINALSKMNYPQTAELAIENYLKSADKKVLESILVAKAEWSGKLLDAIEAKKLPLNSLSAQGAQQISVLNETMKQRVIKVWGTVNQSPEGIKDEIRSWTLKLKKKLIGDAKNGKSVYQRTCAACHTLFGEGGNLGPDLGGADRSDLNYLLSNIIDPNQIVPDAYKMTIITLKDGRTVSGFTTELGNGKMEVKNAGVKEVISTADIKSTNRMPTSIMPAGLLNNLKDQEVADLIKYLQQ